MDDRVEGESELPIVEAPPNEAMILGQVRASAYTRP